MSYIEINRKLTAVLIENNKKQRPDIDDRHNSLVTEVSKYANKNGKLLEIGVREGFLFDTLKQAGFKNLYGIDISPEAIETLHERGYEGHVADAQNFLFDERFDTVIISHCLEHCPEPEKVLENIFNIMNQNGILYVAVPKQKKEPVPTKWAHYYCFESDTEFLSFFKKWKILWYENMKVIVKKEIRI
jgi:2-polyprenyl-3-methyl-5-hydroxy-6-metoxy-1,4-benzoquinol methylase